jgi:hypothetical protein
MTSLRALGYQRARASGQGRTASRAIERPGTLPSTPTRIFEPFSSTGNGSSRTRMELHTSAAAQVCLFVSAHSEDPVSAVDVVQHQVDAYNNRDLNRFVSTYSESIAIYRMPSVKPSISGKIQLAEFYSTQRFNLSELRAEIVNRIALGNKIIDHERIWGVRAGPFEIAVIYEVVGDLIERVWVFSPE